MVDLTRDDGRTLRVYEAGAGFPVFWHHGTPNVGAPPEPLFAPGIRWVSYDRPGYGGSTRNPGRNVADCTADVAAICDALAIDRFCAWGVSGGGPHVVATAALLAERCVAVASLCVPRAG